MSLNEVLTCVRENIPAIAVVFNNEQWGAEKKNQVDFYKDRFIGTNLTNPSFAEISRTMGAEGIKVTNPEDIGKSICLIQNFATRWVSSKKSADLAHLPAHGAIVGIEK